MEPASIGPHGAARCIVQVSIDTARIRDGFASEKPPVPDDEWNAGGYVAHRKAAYRAALHGVRADTPAGPLMFEVSFEDEHEKAEREATNFEETRRATRVKGLAAIAVRSVEVPPGSGDRVQVAFAAPDHGADVTLDACAAAASAALRAVFADTGVWRLFLLPEYFARHRAWRSAVGSPIQH